MKKSRPFTQRGWSQLLTGLFPIVCASFLLLPLVAGCGKPPNLVHRYILEYPPPKGPAAPKIGEAIKVELFSVAQAFNSPAMVYQTNPFKSDTYNYHRWRVNPGNMVTDYLLRDLRNSGLFKAALPAGSAGKSRYLLEGGVEEIQEIDEADGWKAALALNITLLDQNRHELTERVVFQKNYRAVELMTEKTPHGLAQGMSRAMQRLSGEIIADIYKAAAK